jgi:hypothetical protein
MRGLLYNQIVVSEETLEKQHRDLLFGVRRSVRYHGRRQQFYETWNTLTSAFSVLFGSAAILSLLALTGSYSKQVTIAAAAVVTIMSTVDLVVGTVRKAQLHADLGRRFSELECKFVGELSPERLAECRNERIMIEADEPPQLRVVSVLTHNDLCLATGLDDFYHIPFWRRLLGQVVNLDPRPSPRSAMPSKTA